MCRIYVKFNTLKGARKMMGWRVKSPKTEQKEAPPPPYVRHGPKRSRFGRWQAKSLTTLRYFTSSFSNSLLLLLLLLGALCPTHITSYSKLGTAAMVPTPSKSVICDVTNTYDLLHSPGRPIRCSARWCGYPFPPNPNPP